MYHTWPSLGAGGSPATVVIVPAKAAKAVTLPKLVLLTLDAGITPLTPSVASISPVPKTLFAIPRVIAPIVTPY